jgi:hypothetical protein
MNIGKIEIKEENEADKREKNNTEGNIFTLFYQ